MNRRDLLWSAAALPAAALGQQADWKPLTFDAHQNATVIALTDLIIPATDTPGAKDANVNRYIDLFLTDGADRERIAFLEGLGWLDRFARDTHGETFVECSREQQTGLLKTMEAAGAPKTGADFFRTVKRMTAQIYYNTALGFRELNKGGRVPKSFACA